MSLLALLMLTFKLQAIRVELDEPESALRLALPLLTALFGYQLLLSIGPPGAPLLFMLGVLLAMNARVTYWALRLAWRQRALSGYGIALAFGLMVAAYLVRLINIGLGRFDAEILSQGYDAFLLALASLIGIILSNIAWLGLALERLVRAQVVAAAS